MLREIESEAEWLSLGIPLVMMKKMRSMLKQKGSD